MRYHARLIKPARSENTDVRHSRKLLEALDMRTCNFLDMSCTISLRRTTMPSTVRELILVLDTFFPPYLPMFHALFILCTIASLHQVLALHHNQRSEPRQPAITAWLRACAKIIEDAFLAHGDEEEIGLDEDERRLMARDISHDMDSLYEPLGLSLDQNSLLPPLCSAATCILVTKRLTCKFCPPTARYRSLRLHASKQTVKILRAEYRWSTAILLVGHCRTCRSDYYPDQITYRNAAGQRIQQLEYEATHLLISGHGIWAERQVALAQENAVREFRAGWSNFANWVNSTVADTEGPQMSHRQSRRLFIHHFARRLLTFHGQAANFTCPAKLDTTGFAEHVRNMVGKNGGSIADSMHHGCMDCTHRKRYRTDLVEDGAVLEDVMNAGRLADDPVPNNAPVRLHSDQQKKILML